jgi:hypothetical protein
LEYTYRQLSVIRVMVGRKDKDNPKPQLKQTVKTWYKMDLI